MVQYEQNCLVGKVFYLPGSIYILQLRRRKHDIISRVNLPYEEGADRTPRRTVVSVR
jgi:hypothetical protein